jgi:hypothetical protein
VANLARLGATRCFGVEEARALAEEPLPIAAALVITPWRAYCPATRRSTPIAMSGRKSVQPGQYSDGCGILNQ